jgi:hypothetical protein
VSGKYASLANRFGTLSTLVVAATFAIIGLAWIGVLVAVAIVAVLAMIGLRGSRRPVLRGSGRHARRGSPSPWRRAGLG